MSLVIGSGSPADLAAIRTAAFGGPLRTAAPVCEVRCTASFNAAAATDYLAIGGWASPPGGDPDGMFAPFNGTTRAHAQIILPIPGRYETKFFARSTATSGQTAIKVLLNGTSVLTDSIASDTIAAGAEGAPPKAEVSRMHAAGDVLRWAVWSSVANTFAPQSGNFAGVLTYIVTRWVGPN